MRGNEGVEVPMFISTPLPFGNSFFDIAAALVAVREKGASTERGGYSQTLA
jgi:hypothetical protein